VRREHSPDSVVLRHLETAAFEQCREGLPIRSERAEPTQQHCMKSSKEAAHVLRDAFARSMVKMRAFGIRLPSAALIAASGGRLSEVRINRLTDEVFYAQAVIESTEGTRSVDARPSDAIALALQTGAPIRVAGEVMDQAGSGRIELSEKATPEARSARDHAEEIRIAIAQPRSGWTKQGLF
jgi:bifunctional DNase/RNase